MTTSYEPIIPRARIGFIIPSSNRMVEPQMQRFMPAGVVPHFSRIGMTNRHKAPLEQLMPRITDAAELLADSKCDVTVLQCTGTSMSGGVDMDKRVVAEIEKVTGRPALSTASALNAAFAALGARRLVFISETKQDDHDKKLAYLREAGFDIVADKAASLAGTDAYCTTPPALLVRPGDGAAQRCRRRLFHQLREYPQHRRDRGSGARAAASPSSPATRRRSGARCAPPASATRFPASARCSGTMPRCNRPPRPKRGEA